MFKNTSIRWNTRVKWTTKEVSKIKYSKHNAKDDIMANEWNYEWLVKTIKTFPN